MREARAPGQWGIFSPVKWDSLASFLWLPPQLSPPLARTPSALLSLVVVVGGAVGKGGHVVRVEAQELPWEDRPNIGVPEMGVRLGEGHCGRNLNS